MEKLINIMEYVVEEKYKQIEKELDCCKCDQCVADIMAYALNSLPSKYVTSDVGKMLVQLDYVSSQHGIDVVTALVQAAEIIKKNPRHPDGEKKAEPKDEEKTSDVNARLSE